MDQERIQVAEKRNYSENSSEIGYTHPNYYGSQTDQSAQEAESYAANTRPIQVLDAQTSYQEHGALEKEGSQTGTEEEPPKEGAKRKKWWSIILGGGGLVLALGSWLLKLKSLGFLLKFGTAGLSALVTVALYSTVFGWTFAVGLVISLFIHEMGHALVMKQKGIPVNGMVFIPFVGAAVFGRRAANARDEAEIGIAGPIAGALAASVCLILAHIYPGSLWAPLAYMNFFINLFNMIPMLPLDGGHILGAVDRRVWVVGFVGLLAFQIWLWFQGNYSWWLLLLVVVAALQLRAVGIKPQSEEERTFYTVPLSTRFIFSFLYFGLAAVLFIGMTMSQTLMPISFGN